MTDETLGVLTGFLFVACIVFLFSLAYMASQRDVLKEQAIHLNYAEYNPTNGVWQWKTNSAILK